MNLLLLAAAVGLLALGHYLKTVRWKEFVEIYEQPDEKRLLQALSLGYFVDFFLPFRVGDIFRILYAGRRMKNGMAFSLSTVIVDRYLDVMVVAVIFVILYSVGLKTPIIYNSVIFYAIFAGILIVLSLLAIKYSGGLKKATRKVCSIFNSTIELKLLFFFWTAIQSFKDVFRGVSRKTLFLTTFFMWFSYLASYYTLALFLSGAIAGISFENIFSMLFANSNINASSFNLTYQAGSISVNLQIIMAVYLILPLGILMLISFIFKRNSNKENEDLKTYINLLPHVQDRDRLNFLEAYFDGTHSKAYLRWYMELNKDINIIQDYSSGSDATTLLCMNDEETFYRKYAFGPSGDKLYMQVQWLTQNKDAVPTTKIIHEKHNDHFCVYDMEYKSNATGLFRYIHSAPVESSWEIILNTLTDIERGIHSVNVRPAESDKVREYIQTKVTDNINKICKSRELSHITKYDYIRINGRSYKNLPLLMPYLEDDYLYQVFINDTYSNLHGDLTVENIICWEESERKYYLIDPNTGNIHDTPMLDYSKLLQSLHGGYEFLMRLDSVVAKEDEITFLLTSSSIYNKVFSLFRKYLSEKFSPQQLISIYLHEVVHWIRLLTYKIKQWGPNSVIFYAGMIMVANDVVKWIDELGESHAGKK